MESLSNQESELKEDVRWRKRARREGTNLVGVLAGGGNSDSAGPVVVEVSQLVGQLLEVLGGQTRGVLDTTRQPGEMSEWK